MCSKARVRVETLPVAAARGRGGAGNARLGWEGGRRTRRVKEAGTLIFTLGAVGEIWRFAAEKYSDVEICEFKRCH